MNRIAANVSLSPTILVILSIASVQVGAAFAKLLFPEVGPAGMVFMRVGFAAMILFFLQRPKWTPQVQQQLGTLLYFGIVLALMNLSFYAAIARIPLGVAATLEFTGPLGLAALRAQRWLDIVWVILAFVGVLLLAPIGGFTLDAWGVAFALVAAFCWAMYIVLSSQVGQTLPHLHGLCWAMVVATVLVAPLGVISAKTALLQPKLLVVGIAVAILSSMVPYSLELIALRSLPINVFGVLKSLEPMSAAVAGLLVLKETLTIRAIFAIVLVSLAAAGASRFRSNIPKTEIQ